MGCEVSLEFAVVRFRDGWQVVGPTVSAYPRQAFLDRIGFRATLKPSDLQAA